VADFSRILAGPLCTMLLADAGARVIKVEEPGRGDETRRWGPPFAGGESAYYLSVNRNKESLTANLKSRAGRRVARRLIEQADVVVENFRDDQRRQFGLTAASVRRVNTRAVLCSITGFEPDSVEADLPGYDLLAQASGGLMWITGEPGGDPMKVGVAVADVLTAHYAYGAIVSALYVRGRSGRGSHLQVSLLGATTASLVNVAQAHLITGEEARRYGNAHPSIVPYQAFRGSDRLFVLAAATDRHYELLCDLVLGRRDLARDDRYRTNEGRVTHRATLVPELERVFGTRGAQSWVDACRKRGVPAALVSGLSELFAGHADLVARLVHPTAGALPMVRHPIRVDSRPLPIRSAPPLLGEHTSRILAELGFSDAQAAALRKAGAV